MLVLANDPSTQNINSACYSIVLNRLTKLINCKGNLPSALIIDEVPTLFVHKVENLVATARSNQVAVLLGLAGASAVQSAIREGDCSDHHVGCSQRTMRLGAQ